MSRRLWIALAVAMALLAFGATTASAHRTGTDTLIIVSDVRELEQNGIAVEGRLHSDREGCKGSRTVLLFAVEDNGTPQDPGDDQPTFLGADQTSRNGAFVIAATYPAGTDYFVLHVTRENRAPSGHTHICRAATERVDFPNE